MEWAYSSVVVVAVVVFSDLKKEKKRGKGAKKTHHREVSKGVG